ncbi:tRNA (cytidine(34)-2'-O)-methyltransferase [uncultured Ferrovibrio sp.]|jgi:tRNA (cytidine/uridine-2'-O-)-methyltransferase|uniref:tRNA (cytidine(34)-2'-O)-methyltransferase n=1 Tax=uncultured Ferrovibrio sp. TaxID=1576913 RepID=UPI0026399630|nr:tRNA (cytidine(34)-2'-O)-methyltransferase [uncultured Ferrovibrio sp.]
MRIALFEPDIPPNLGTILRLGACLETPVHVIEPCGFPFSVQAIRRSAMDYLEHAEICRHDSWEAFQREKPAGRLVLMTTKAAIPYTDFQFAADDIILLGRESKGVPEHVHAAADARLLIPIKSGLRSINVATAAAMVLGEGLRQLQAFPRREPHPSLSRP